MRTKEELLSYLERIREFVEIVKDSIEDMENLE